MKTEKQVAPSAWVWIGGLLLGPRSWPGQLPAPGTSFTVQNRSNTLRLDIAA